MERARRKAANLPECDPETDEGETDGDADA